jgi:toxin ParE1/3/4
MARYRLSAPAKSDVVAILRKSEELHGKEARIRYRACLTAAMRRVAADPEGRSTADYPELAPDIRSFHVRHSRNESDAAPVANPVHVIFYRILSPGTVEIARVLHERMDPTQHIGLRDRNTI